MQPFCRRDCLPVAMGMMAGAARDCEARTTGHSVSRSGRAEHESVIEEEREKLQQRRRISSRNGWDEMLMLQQQYRRPAAAKAGERVSEAAIRCSSLTFARLCGAAVCRMPSAQPPDDQEDGSSPSSPSTSSSAAARFPYFILFLLFAINKHSLTHRGR